ncbi:DUF305 domain-containing protein [Actinomadura spongiicola]|uniref:DUF305 domain-containing protein n=2 Tax=Actinomadura spongiicola TaxID=2303421 RepID=A0A372GE69_9ACTN|nr:DUF305 domain-containing protein [Actinomadura spongiicola]
MTPKLPHPATRHPRSRHSVLAGMLAALAVLSTACGGTSDPAEAKPKQSAPADHDADDVMFLQMMIAHRQQVLDIVRLAPDRSRRGEVQTLATTLEKDSTTEVRQMTSWLTAWSKPTTLQGPVNSHAAHGGLPLIGAAEMKSLKQAKGRDFDTTFLNLLLGHQHNAVQMSQVELKKGVNPAAKKYANDVIKNTTPLVSRLLDLINS